MTNPEETLSQLERRVDKLHHNLELQGINVGNDIKNIKDDIHDLREADRSWVSKERYAPVERLVYGFVGLVLVAVLMAIIALVVRTPS